MNWAVAASAVQCSVALQKVPEHRYQEHAFHDCLSVTHSNCNATRSSRSRRRKPSKMLAILKFITFNTILPLFDMGTDIRAFFLYLSAVAYHPNWAALTLVWIVVPFVLHLIKFIYHL